MSDAEAAVQQAQAALAAAQAAVAAEQAQAKAQADSQAAQQAEAALGKGVGGFVGDLIRRVEALEEQVFGHSQEATSTPAADPTSESESPDVPSQPAQEAPQAAQESLYSPPSVGEPQ